MYAPHRVAMASVLHTTQRKRLRVDATSIRPMPRLADVSHAHTASHTLGARTTDARRHPRGSHRAPVAQSATLPAARDLPPTTAPHSTPRPLHTYITPAPPSLHLRGPSMSLPHSTSRRRRFAPPSKPTPPHGTCALARVPPSAAHALSSFVCGWKMTSENDVPRPSRHAPCLPRMPPPRSSLPPHI
jgi:hypothetical protein